MFVDVPAANTCKTCSTRATNVNLRSYWAQNVALQMGLRLETKGGAMVSQVQQAVLRCDGCRAVCLDTSKLFCPSCGHASLARVSVTVGPAGVEQYGIRKKHVLRGTRCIQLSSAVSIISASWVCTDLHRSLPLRLSWSIPASETQTTSCRFSLPKPRGGRGSTNPILSEDVYNARVRKPRKPKADDDDPVVTSNGGIAAQQPPHIAQALSYLHTDWRHNPNERKAISRSNRRR
jgi:Nin one binding (NOB1) Zn-ribbon like